MILQRIVRKRAAKRDRIPLWADGLVIDPLQIDNLPLIRSNLLHDLILLDNLRLLSYLVGCARAILVCAVVALACDEIVVVHWW